MKAIEFNHVSYQYPRGQLALKDVSFSVNEGDFLALIGPNGGGKTTLVKLLLGLIKPTRGFINVYSKPSNKTLNSVSYLPQHTNIEPIFPIDVQEVVLGGLLGQTKSGIFYKKSDKKKANDALKRVNLEHLALEKFSKLSGGQKQRILIARALVKQSKILVLDEPVANMDKNASSDFYELLGHLKNNHTILMISHDTTAIPVLANSVGCVNQNFHYHSSSEISDSMLQMIYPQNKLNLTIENVIHQDTPNLVIKKHTS